MTDIQYLGYFIRVLAAAAPFLRIKDWPLWLKTLALLLILGLSLPILGPGILALRSGPPSDEAIQQHGLGSWPVPVLASILGALVGWYFASTSVLLEPLANNALVCLPRLANHFATGLVGGLLYGTGLVTFFFFFSGRVFIPLFNWPTVLLLAGAVACGLTLARFVRFLLPSQGEAWRVSLQAVALALFAGGVSFLLDWLFPQVWLWSVWLTSFSVAL